MTRAVTLWLVQSLLGASLVIVWVAAARSAKCIGAPFAARWVFPWAALLAAKRPALLIAECAALVGYALSVWLARAP